MHKTRIRVFNQQRDVAISTLSARPIVHYLLAAEKRATDAVIIHFVSARKICALHEEYFQDPSPTDCISFPMDQEEEDVYHVLGEVFICPKIAREYAKSHKTDVYQETTLYLVHGLLHLLGYDDQEKADVRKMRRAEKRHMEAICALGILLNK